MKSLSPYTPGARGFLLGLSVFFPYTGKIIPGVPALIGGYLAIVLFILGEIGNGALKKIFDWRSITPTQKTLLLCLIIMMMSILASATYDQHTYFLHPLRWTIKHGTPENYVTTKLAVFIIANIPSLLAGLSILFLRQDHNTVGKGVIAALIFCGLYAAMKILYFVPVILSHDYALSRSFFSGEYTSIISIVGMGPILGASIPLLYITWRESSERLKRYAFFFLTFITLFALFSILQRFLLLVTLCLIGILFYKKPPPKKTLSLSSFFSLLLVFLMLGSSHGDFITYWNDFFSGEMHGILYRIEGLLNTLECIQKSDSLFHPLLYGKGLGFWKHSSRAGSFHALHPA